MDAKAIEGIPTGVLAKAAAAAEAILRAEAGSLDPAIEAAAVAPAPVPKVARVALSAHSGTKVPTSKNEPMVMIQAAEAPVQDAPPTVASAEYSKSSPSSPATVKEPVQASPAPLPPQSAENASNGHIDVSSPVRIAQAANTSVDMQLGPDSRDRNHPDA